MVRLTAISTLTLVCFTAIISLLLLLNWRNGSHQISSTCHFSSINSEKYRTDNKYRDGCDYSKGKWIKHEAEPLYNGSCEQMRNSLNCLKNRRPDKEYLKWRWKPKSCDLPRFDTHIFLKMLTNKHIAFVGDSLAWNQLESLICMVSSVATPKISRQISVTKQDGEERFHYKKWRIGSNYNVTISGYWSPFLVQGNERNNSFPQSEIYTDRINEFWLRDYHLFDTVVITVGRWFYMPGLFYMGEKDNILLGCNYCSDSLNITRIDISHMFKRILRNSFKAIIKKMRTTARNGNHVIINSYLPMHYEGGVGSNGTCTDTLPYEEGVRELDPFDIVMREAEMEEVEAASDEVSKLGYFRLEMMDITKLSWFRSDAHPSIYRVDFPIDSYPKHLLQHDCLHWCLPGAVDTWNEILLQLIKRWWVTPLKRGGG